MRRHAVMVGLVPPSTSSFTPSAVQDVDARHKREHDDLEARHVQRAGLLKQRLAPE